MTGLQERLREGATARWKRNLGGVAVRLRVACTKICQVKSSPKVLLRHLMRRAESRHEMAMGVPRGL